MSRRDKEADDFRRDFQGRVPPNDLDAEAAVLSACLLKPDDFDQVAEVLQAEHFYSGANKEIWQTAVDMSLANEPIDLVTLAGKLRDRLKLDQVGGTPYLGQIINATPAYANVLVHAKRVLELSRLRRAIAASNRFIVEAAACEDVQGLLEEHEKAIFDIGQTARGSEVEHIGDVGQRAMKTILAAKARGGAVTGTPTGFEYLDKLMSGLHAGDFTIIAGRPSMGKTSLAMNIATNVAFGTEQNPSLGVAVFSLEMPKEQLATRMIATEARVDFQHVRTGDLKQDWPAVAAAAKSLGTLPLWIDDTPGLNIVKLRAKLRRVAAAAQRGEKGTKTRLGLVAIDYIQLMRSVDPKLPREQQIGEISRGMKELAKEFGVPVIGLSQLNRSVETRGAKDKRPMLSDLRESGNLEQDADNILFLYRDEYYNKGSADKGIAEIIIGKQRNGPTGIVRTKFEPSYTRFDNIANDDYDFAEYDQYSGAESGEDYGDKVSP